MEQQQRKEVMRGELWMVLVSLALFFIPAINGLVAGLFGGYRIGDTKRALAAAVVAGVVTGVGTWLLLKFTHPPLIGHLKGVALLSWVLVSVAALFTGVVLGAISRQMATHRPAHA